MQISGLLNDDSEVSDYYVWVSSMDHIRDENERVKIVYQRVSGREVSFSENIPLLPGANRIAVIARDDQGMSGTGIIYIYRHTEGELQARE